MQIIILSCSKALPAPQYPRYKIETPWHGGLQPVPSPASSCPFPFTPRAPVILKCSQADLNVKAHASRPSSQLPLLLTLTLTHHCCRTRHTAIHMAADPSLQILPNLEAQEDLGISTPKHPWHQLSTCVKAPFMQGCHGLPAVPLISGNLNRLLERKAEAQHGGHLC